MMIGYEKNQGTESTNLGFLGSIALNQIGEEAFNNVMFNWLTNLDLEHLKSLAGLSVQVGLNLRNQLATTNYGVQAGYSNNAWSLRCRLHCRS